MGSWGGNLENHLAWNSYKGSSIDSYVVERFQDTGWQKIVTLNRSSATYTDTHRTYCHISYNYRITGYWQDGKVYHTFSDTSFAVPFDTTRPKAPEIKYFSVINDKEAELNWKLSDPDVVLYELWLKRSGGKWKIYDTTGVRTKYTFKNLNTKDSIYCTKIVAFDSCAGNRSLYSETHCAIQLTGKRGNLENDLYWTSYKGFDSGYKYFIYRWRGNWQIVDSVTSPDTTFTHQGIPCNKPVKYRVEARQKQYSTWSDTLSLIPFDTVKPDAPVIKKAGVLTQRSVELVFDTSVAGDVSHYEVWARANGQKFRRIAIINHGKVSPLRFVHKNIRPDTGYYCYYVKAVDTCAANTSIPGRIHCPVELRGKAHNLASRLEWSPYRGFKNATHFIQRKEQGKWNWDTTSDARKFEIWRDQGNGSFKHFSTVKYDSQFIDGSATPGNVAHGYYVITIDSCDVQNRSIPSDTDRIMVPEIATGACHPENRLEWTSYQDLPQGTAYYNIWHSVNGKRFTKHPEGQALTRLKFTDTLVQEGSLYCYRAEAVDTLSGYTAYSDSMCIKPRVFPAPDTSRMLRTTIPETGKKDGKILLEWRRSPVADTFARGYRVYYSTSSGKDSLLKEQRSLLDTTYLHKNINTVDGEHLYKVVTYNLCNVKGPISRIHTPVDLSIVNRNLKTTLRWSKYRGFPVKNYEIWRKVDGSPYRLYRSMSSYDTGFNDTHIRCDHIYAYKILTNREGTGVISWSDTVGLKGYDTIPPGAADMLYATVKKTGTNSGAVKLEFDPARQKNRSGYYIFKSQAGTGFYLYDTVYSSSLSSIDYNDNAVNTKDVNSSYYLRSFDSCGNISVNYSRKHRTIRLMAGKGNEFITVNWTTYGGWPVKYYRLYRNGALLDTVGGNVNRYIDSQVLCDQYYRYRVEAVSNVDTGITSFSNRDSAKPEDFEPPATTYLRSVSVIRDNELIDITWDRSGNFDAMGYALYRQNVGEKGMKKLAEVDKKATAQYVDTVVISGNSVCYYVKVFDHCRNISKLSNPGCVILLNASAGKLYNDLEWEDYYQWRRGVDHYNIYRSEDGGKMVQIGSIDSFPKYRDETLKNSTEEFCYQVEAVEKSSGKRGRSMSTKACVKQPQLVHIPNSFSPGISEGLNDQFGPEGLYIENYEMQIYNRWGQKVFETHKGEIWDGKYQGNLVPEGIYIYHLIITGVNGRTKSYTGNVLLVR